MGHIVYITNGLAGNVGTALELAARLAPAGHRVSFVSANDVGARIRQAGHEFYLVTADRSFLTESAEVDQVPGRAERIRRRRRLRRRSLENDELDMLVERLAPDLLLIDIELHFAVIVTARLGIPAGLVTAWFDVFRRPDYPPLSSPIVPDGSLRTRARSALAWWALDWRKYTERFGRPAARLRGALRPVGYHERDDTALCALAQARGYPLERYADRRAWVIPFSYRHLPILCFNARELDFPHHPAPNLHYVGPMVPPEAPAPAPATPPDPLPDPWRAMLARRQAGERRPLVYCSLGSRWATDLPFLGDVVEVFRRRHDWDLVLGLGARADPGALGAGLENVAVLPWAPQLEILQHAHCAITHGGINTINECLSRGVPLVVRSSERVDQDGCAARIAYHRLGTVLDPTQTGPGSIERAIEHGLGDTGLHGRITRMRSAFASYHDHAATAVDALLR